MRDTNAPAPAAALGAAPDPASLCRRRKHGLSHREPTPPPQAPTAGGGESASRGPTSGRSRHGQTAQPLTQRDRQSHRSVVVPAESSTTVRIRIRDQTLVSVDKLLAAITPELFATAAVQARAPALFPLLPLLVTFSLSFSLSSVSTESPDKQQHNVCVYLPRPQSVVLALGGSAARPREAVEFVVPHQPPRPAAAAERPSPATTTSGGGGDEGSPPSTSGAAGGGGRGGGDRGGSGWASGSSLDCSEGEEDPETIRRVFSALPPVLLSLAQRIARNLQRMSSPTHAALVVD